VARDARVPLGTSRRPTRLDGGVTTCPGENEYVTVATRSGRRDAIRVALVSGGFALGIMLIVWGVTGSVTGRESIGLPDAIESVAPSPNDQQVLSKTEVSVDLVPNTEAELIIDGIVLETVRLGEATAEPGRQVELPPTAIYDPGNAAIRFQPREGASIESWTRGVHIVTVVYWDVELGREAARRYTWSFTVL
jgi:hypothetical protein